MANAQVQGWMWKLWRETTPKNDKTSFWDFSSEKDFTLPIKKKAKQKEKEKDLPYPADFPRVTPCFPMFHHHFMHYSPMIFKFHNRCLSPIAKPVGRG